MQAHGFVRNLRILLIGAGPLVVAACGGGNVSIGTGGSSSGSGGSALHGTFFGYTGNSQLSFQAPSTQKDNIFGVIASDGTGFFADTQAPGSQSVFSMDAASSTGSSSVNGFFNAYASSGSNLGDGTTIALGGNLTGTLSSTSGGTQAALTYAFPSGTYNNTASIILDTPPLTPTSIVAGTYTANTGTSAVATSAISTNTADIYTVNFSSPTTFILTNVGGCRFSGTASPDGTFNVFHLAASVTGGCPGSSTGGLTLTGLASFLPAPGHSPLGGPLAKNTLVLELDDSNSSSTSKKFALAVVATQQ